MLIARAIRYQSTYFPEETLFFAYKSCDSSFCGNDWVGQGVECDGDDTCPCVGTTATTSGTFMEDVPSIGDWCYPWDDEFDYCGAGGESFGADWCKDSWCYVDTSNCALAT